jgi:hypothetical protein
MIRVRDSVVASVVDAKIDSLSPEATQGTTLLSRRPRKRIRGGIE